MLDTPWTEFAFEPPERRAQASQTLKEDPDRELARTIWDSVRAFEQAPATTPFELLQDAGLTLSEPDNVTDAELPAKIHAIRTGLATHNIYLKHIDHLSDRELYAHLYWEVLRRETIDASRLPGATCYLDLIGDQNHKLYLVFYADEQERQFWAKQYPEELLPPHRDPAYPRPALT